MVSPNLCESGSLRSSMTLPPQVVALTSNMIKNSAATFGSLCCRSRNGVSISDCDLNHDGEISFAEAYSYAVVASETIDVPLKTSDILLKTYSRLDASPEASEADSDESEEQPSVEAATVNPSDLFLFTGTLQRFMDHADSVSGATVAKLSKVLGIGLDTDLALITKEYEENRRRPFMRGRDRGPGGVGGRRSSGRRQLLAEIGEKWPELAEPDNWMKSDELRRDHQEALLKEIQELPSWKAYQERAMQIEKDTEAANQREMRAGEMSSSAADTRIDCLGSESISLRHS